MEVIAKGIEGQILDMIASGAISATVVLLIATVAQGLKQIKAITRFAVTFPFVLAIPVAIFYIIVDSLPLREWPQLYASYALCAKAAYHFLKLKKPKWFKSNHNLIEQPKERRTKKSK